MTSPARPQRPSPQPPANATRVEGVDAWDYLPLAADAAVAFVWAHGDRTLVALGLADEGAPPPDAGWPARVGGRSFDGGAGEGEWAGWPGAWRIRPRTIYASRRPGEVWRLGERSGPARPPAPLDPWTPLAAAAFEPLEGLDRWIAATRRASAAIAAGAAEKIVLARREVAPCPGVGARGPSLLPVLRDSNPEAVTFGLTIGAGTGWFVGATPETLVAQEDGWLSTEALAGTSAEGPAGLDNPKERAEQAWVVRGIEEALAPVSLGLERLGPVAKRAGHLYHWQTRFRGRAAPGHGVFDLADRLQPTPAVGGTPRAAALRFIAENEPHGRGWYAGAIGWEDRAGDGHAVVALRSALLRGDRVHVYAGAGIVAGSEPEREWAETAAKLEICKRALARAGGPGR